MYLGFFFRLFFSKQKITSSIVGKENNNKPKDLYFIILFKTMTLSHFEFFLCLLTPHPPASILSVFLVCLSSLSTAFPSPGKSQCWRFRTTPSAKLISS